MEDINRGSECIFLIRSDPTSQIQYLIGFLRFWAKEVLIMGFRFNAVPPKVFQSKDHYKTLNQIPQIDYKGRHGPLESG
ncbi:hypothetical protein C5167_046214 [Papaver somniferum]|uniref:Uncharacterized protein n=1 Tax=Papaver somniferum TaxID=3469 RepID=A0A4Y7LFG4_PAPSO|nr:hypothetical protein C5167_046214 [Papaver somniferum]